MVAGNAVPAVEQNTGLFVLQKGQMELQLPERFGGIGAVSRQPAQSGQEQDGHEDRIRPYLLGEAGVFGYSVLESAFTGARCFPQHPLSDPHGNIQVFGVAGFPVQRREDGKGRHGVDYLYLLGQMQIAVGPADQLL
ncbi:hypothetical protein D3C75_972180 [compost metagenome]